MLYKIKKGKHYAQPMRLGIWFGKTSFTWKVKFTDSCIYDIGMPDQLDINKLCGVGRPFGIFKPQGVKWWQLWNYQHSNSYRFGWRPIIQEGAISVIELVAYCYVNKERIIKPITKMPCNVDYVLSLVFKNNSCFFYVRDIDSFFIQNGVTVTNVKAPFLTYNKPVYFGGNQTAPQDIYINLTK